MREAKDEHERKALADVQQHGWHVLKVMEDNEGPAFAYTVGLYHSFGHPELIVVGLPEVYLGNLPQGSPIQVLTCWQSSPALGGMRPW